MRRAAVITGVAAALLLVFAPSANAHGDSPLVNGAVAITPGGEISYRGQLHYHRLVADISADGPVTVRLLDTTGDEVLARSGHRIAINELIRCCDGVTWSPHELVIANPGASAVSVQARAHLVHDDLAVMALEAEGGVSTSIAAFAAIVSVALWVQYRRRTPLPIRKVWLTLGAAATLVLAAVAYSTVRYGFAGAGAMVAGGYDLPLLPVNRIASRGSLLIALAVALWTWSAARWARSRRTASTPQWLLLGFALVDVAILTGIAVGWTYGAWTIPLALAAAVSAPIVTMIAVSQLRARGAAHPRHLTRR
ncbi:MAG: hypothetical protein GEV04_21860 [Actinophytocola sp.]|nr:hypothetical protein [Actinophytocola sp.]